MKKIIITLGFVTALLAGCNGDGSTQRTGTQNTTVKISTPSVVAQSAAVAQIPGQIIIESGGYNITFTPTDPQNESIYASIQYGFTGTTATSYSNTESSFLVPHRKYNVTIMNVGGTPVSQNLQFRFAHSGSLAPISESSVPPIFAKIMQNNGVLTLNNGTLDHNQNLHFMYSNDSGNPTYSAVITPFYAGALNITDANGSIIASANVGNIINPIFENSYNARPLLGGSGNYKIQIETFPSANLYFYVDHSMMLNGVILDLESLAKEGRYFSSGLLLRTVINDSGASVFFVSPKYHGFSTTLAIPILFGVSSRINPDDRVCSGSIFYTNNNNANITMYSNNFTKNDSTPAPDSLGLNDWGSAYCISQDNGQRYDIGTISDYDKDNRAENTYAVRLAW